MIEASALDSSKDGILFAAGVSKEVYVSTGNIAGVDLRNPRMDLLRYITVTNHFHMWNSSTAKKSLLREIITKDFNANYSVL